MKKAAVVSQGGLRRTIDDDSPLAAPPLTELLGLVVRAVRIEPRDIRAIWTNSGSKQIPATRRFRGPHRWLYLTLAQHDFAKVNAVVLSVKSFLTICWSP
jgi:hypothetical protein